jgi:hypothetical protein
MEARGGIMSGLPYNIVILGMVFGGYMNYAFFGPDFKSPWMERGWASKLKERIYALCK